VVAVKNIAILGSTGSIGTNALDVVEQRPDLFKVVSLAAARSVETLAVQARKHNPRLIVVLDGDAAQRIKQLLPSDLARRVVHGPAGYIEAVVSAGADVVLSAMVGAAGLIPTYAAVQAGLTVALANKETLVAGGEVVMKKAAETGAQIVPVDSEHAAIFQALMGSKPEEVKSLWLTASGGPFRAKSAAELEKVTPAEALKHPNWSMGPKITVDSATLMNKGLEVLEASWLFEQPLDKVRVVIHPQSVVHSLVEFVDGTMLAQMGVPDMRLPIASALTHPERMDWDLPRLELTQLKALTFEEPDINRFPALGLAYAAGRAGGDAPSVLNAANEVAVDAFLTGKLDFNGITACVETILERHDHTPVASVADVLEADRWARKEAREWLESRGEK
jgi:1-deoxy-D-xylulose-5-phosphate reductoisomerase